MLSTGDIQWAAGLLEGEGCFQYKTSPSITIGQADEDVVEKMDHIFGPGHRWLANRQNPNWKPIHYWQLSGSKAVQVMMTVYTLMCTRRQEKIREILAHWRTKAIRMPKGMGLRNPNSPYYRGPSGRWT